MILPSKHLQYNRALLGVGGDILSILENEKTVSELWELFQQRKSALSITFDWFILALCFLYAIKAISYDDGVIGVTEKQ